MMEINGKEVTFRASVGAMMKIAALCPDHDINNADKLFSSDTVQTLSNTAKFVSYLSGGALSEEEVLDMDVDQFMAIQTEAVNAFRRDQKGQVKTAPKKAKATEPEVVSEVTA